MVNTKFKVGDKVRFVPENYEWDIKSDSAWGYREVVGKVGTIVEVLINQTEYPYDVSFGYCVENQYDVVPFREEELELIND